MHFFVEFLIEQTSRLKKDFKKREELIKFQENEVVK